MQVRGYENGNFVGPTILCDVTTNMDCFKVFCFMFLILFCFQNEWIWVIMILSRRRVESKTLAYSWQHCIFCWAGRNIWTGSSVHAGIVYSVCVCVALFAFNAWESEFVVQVDWLPNFVLFDHQQAASLEEAITIINRNRYLFLLFWSEAVL